MLDWKTEHTNRGAVALLETVLAGAVLFLALLVLARMSYSQLREVSWAQERIVGEGLLADLVETSRSHGLCELASRPELVSPEEEPTEQDEAAIAAVPTLSTPSFTPPPSDPAPGGASAITEAYRSLLASLSVRRAVRVIMDPGGRRGIVRCIVVLTPRRGVKLRLEQRFLVWADMPCAVPAATGS